MAPKKKQDTARRMRSVFQAAAGKWKGRVKTTTAKVDEDGQTIEVNNENNRLINNSKKQKNRNNQFIDLNTGQKSATKKIRKQPQRCANGVLDAVGQDN